MFERLLIKECGKKNSAVDPMPTSLVIDLNDVLLPTITKIINLSLDSGTFADVWKCALVHPLLKTVGVDPLFVNCRPISHLQYISKLTEKVLFSQTHSHMMAHSLYPELQSSYRRHHGTETALLKVTNNILLKMNTQEVTLLVTLDLSSAFDTVNQVRTFESAKPTISTLRYLRDDEQNVNNRLITAAVNLLNAKDDIIVTGAQQEECTWTKDQKRQKILPMRISTENNSSQSSMYKHKSLPTMLKTCDILARAINLLLPPFDNDTKEEDVDSLVKMLPRSLQPDNDVLCAELTLFRNHF
ncbi:Hypothetical predicted protein [Paramuricea clavata]|uniref:Uncharacterized protein n=1 Tax=Paramuricea clavata TaxID=317549 RepID=A0A7D9I8J5_PARCT|nr:Hypothetical predicted protein [Paramuricea clavata]